MNSLLLISTFGTFLFAVLSLWKAADSVMCRIFSWIPLPAFLLALTCLLGASEIEVSTFPQLLLGAQIGLDPLGCAFLILVSGIWLISGLQSRGHFADYQEARSFRFYFLATFSGTTGLIVAQDAPTFYTGYALMTLGGYGLIINTRAAAAVMAGRVYLVVALIGEMLTLAGLIIASSNAKSFAIADIAQSIGSSSVGPLSFWLIFIGFGTKVGLVPLHFWLPRSYYWAPLPAVAVLSGAMTKAGVLGWLRFLSYSESQLASALVLGTGAVMVFYGVIFGILQTRAKTTLAFSSLSQMGYLTVAFAANLEPSAKNAAVTATIVAFAFHHALAKAVLFLGLGVLAHHRSREKARRLVFGALVFCSLVLIGLPFTSGSFAKSLLKQAATGGGTWHAISGIFLTVGSIGTALIMTRFLVLSYRGEHDQVQTADRTWPWATAFMLVLGGAWLVPVLLGELSFPVAHSTTVLEQLKSFLPILGGTFVALVIMRPLLLRHSHLSPRPFETFLQHIYKEIWEEFPHDVNRFARTLARLLARTRILLRVEKRARTAATLAKQLRTSWAIGCTLFLTIGLMLWLLIGESR